MAEIHNLLDDMSKSCEGVVKGHGVCGSVKFNLLKSGKIKCVDCGDIEETQIWLGIDAANAKIFAGVIAIISMTGDDFQTVIQTLIGIGLIGCKERGMDYEQHLKQLIE